MLKLFINLNSSEPISSASLASAESARDLYLLDFDRSCSKNVSK